MLPRIFSAPSLFVTAFVGISLCVLTHGDRMPPNVNPNHYQANQPPPPPPPQHHQQQYQQQVPQQQYQQQQVPQQHHQVPQQQQVPQQHHQQQQQVQQQQQMQPQVAGHGGNGGHHHGGGLLDRDHIEANKEDIGHHFDMPVDTSKMSEQELQFHYFKMHDADNNNMLDGLELVKSLIHWHDPQNHDPNAGVAPPEPKIFPDSELENMIDPILKADDRNGDGFIDYLEFVKAQEAAAAQAATQQRA